MRKTMDAALGRDPHRDVLRFRSPNAEVALPALRGRQLREWKARYAVAARRHALTSEYQGSLSDQSAAIADLILAYDRSGVLGGRDQFTRTWTHEQASQLLKLIVSSIERG